MKNGLITRLGFALAFLLSYFSKETWIVNFGLFFAYGCGLALYVVKIQFKENEKRQQNKTLKR